MYVLAIDTGGTKIAGAIVDEHGTIIEKKALQRMKSGVKVRGESLRMYRELTEYFSAHYEISAIGIGVGGTINADTGVSIAVSGDPSWTNFSVVEAFREFTDIPVAVDNDCKVAIFGESWMGAIKGAKSAVGYIVGTGVGGGYYENGRMQYGHHFEAGELGHFILYPGGRPCGCGQDGCVEMYCSGTALWTEYNRQIGDAALKNGHDFFERVQAGDQTAQAILDCFAADTATALITILNIYDPEVIFIGGGLAGTSEFWWDKMQQEFSRRCRGSHRNTPILKTTLGNDAALIGAAKIAFNMLAQH